MPAAAEPRDGAVVTLHCAEVWGGNSAVDTAVSTASLDVWVYSEPHAGSARGGDVHYLTLCSRGRLARFALADVAGHGDSVGALARLLRRQMRRNMNRLDQAGIARVLNRSFTELSRMGQFATALLATYDTRSNHLIICNAGHPKPMLRRVGEAGWTVLDADARCAVTDAAGGASGLPLGVIEPTDYAQYAVPLTPGDEVLLYTDALVEARDGEGRLLGVEGLAGLLEGVAVGSPDRLIPEALRRVRGVRGDVDADDDVTVIALRRHAGGPPRRTLIERARALGRLLGG